MVACFSWLAEERRSGKKENSFYSAIGPKEGLLDYFYIEDGVERKIVSNKDNRRAIQLNADLKYRLFQSGATFFKTALEELSSFQAAFYLDDQDPFKHRPAGSTYQRFQAGLSIDIGRPFLASLDEDAG